MMRIIMSAYFQSNPLVPNRPFIDFTAFIAAENGEPYLALMPVTVM